MQDKRDKRIQDLGRQYWQKTQNILPGLFDRSQRQGQFFDRVMEDESFKIDAFRFVDVLPALHSSGAVSSHVRDYLLKEGRDLPLTIRTALKMAGGGIASPLAAKVIRANVTELARRFICEIDSKKALKTFRGLIRKNLAFTADILGEATTSDAEAEAYAGKYRDLITLLGEAAVSWPDNRQLNTSPTGHVPLANVSVKVSALDPHLDAADLRNSVGRLKERLLPLLRHAREKNVFINFDLEQWALHGITYDLFHELATDPGLADWPHLGLVVQAYLKSSTTDCDRLLALSRKRETPFTVRLVKGAYWDYEVVHARQNNFTCPVFTRKGLTDANFELLSSRLIENHEFLTPAIASHNLRSLVHALVVAEEKGLEKSAFELQMLYGMAEPLCHVFARDGYRVRIYAPIGELLPGMAYLVRRLLENTSNSGFLRQSFHDGAPIADMLEPPALEAEEEPPSAMVPGDPGTPFANVGLLDFCEEQIRMQFAEAVENIRNQFPLEVPLVLNGEEIRTKKKTTHPSPNDPGMIIAGIARADESHADQAMQAANESFPAWRDRPLMERAVCLEKLADLLEAGRFELAALQTHESGKPWREADADIAEAIDFCRYYARRSLIELGPARQGSMPGEDNILWYEGRGPTIIIAPWNFPLAILCGMTSAALVAGNPVVIKPSSAACSTAYRFHRCLLQAGFPPATIQFLPGSGELAGRYLVEHPLTCQIAFTGSREVGTEIIRLAGDTRPGQREIKRVVCEMGGKNAIIIDEDADPDAALQGVMQSAFGYAGQKCSACSRLIIIGSLFEPFLARLQDACSSLPIGPATEPGSRLGPVIDHQAFWRLTELLEDPPEGARLVYKGVPPAGGLFIPPAIFTVDSPDHPLMQQELFGPVLTVMRAADLDEALEIANRTEFALTGGIYTRSPSNLARVRNAFKVGNLYINRPCTGAIVGRQPFGGYGMSGIGTKAGGSGYLRHFANPRCISENTMRSGFTPDLQM